MSVAEMPVARPARDTRIDVLRALALIAIFINHVPGNLLEHLTHKNFGFSDSAEAFVLISGISAGLAFGATFVPGKRLAVSVRVLRRSFSLYVAHVMTSLVTFAIFAGGALWFSRPDLLSEINLRAVVDRTEEGLLGMVLLGHQFGYNNILSMYAVILLMLPGMLWLHARNPALMLALSGLLWLAAGLWNIAPSNLLDDGYWFLNPFSWQFLFAIGLAASSRARQGALPEANRAVIALCCAYLAVSFVWVVLSLWWIDTSFGLPAVITGFDKTFLSAPRLLHVLALAYLVAMVPALSGWLALPEAHSLTAVGRHGLAIFIFGTILAMVGQVLVFISGKSVLVGTVYVTVGIGLLFAYARYLDWLAGLSRPIAAKAGKQPA
ncbi:OpgC family protein [Rhizobium sp. GN54]|uniref:OpgC family protein n=1 Tax=Rhizobium sp. GN54 TaxID=2898150 RepID=UPI001E43B9CF|nr:OpgC domain-containing protein [Rhizobium sp. GN54]MCD2182530.1 OpgC domain-containing protein [Rhizobium sp. GN54]